MIRLSGSKANESLKSDIENKLNKIEDKLCAAIIRVGEKPDDIYYEKAIEKRLKEFKIEYKNILFDENVKEEEVLNSINDLNNDKSVHGIILLQPLPKHLNGRKLSDAISVSKDIDCVNINSCGNLFINNDNAPCTAAASIELLKAYGVEFEGKNTVVIGRSMVVGKPLSVMLTNLNATVTLCHSKTRNLREITLNADIIFVAVGSAKFIDDTYVSDKAIVVDIGINNDKNGKLCGDVDYESMENKVYMLSPVPGGVGGVTTTVLVKNLINLYNKSRVS